MIRRIQNKLGKGLRNRVQKDKDLLTLLVVYILIVLWVINFNI